MTRKLKGIPNPPDIDSYRKVLFSKGAVVKAKYREIGKKDFQLVTREVTKQALNSLMDKVNIFVVGGEVPLLV